MLIQKPLKLTTKSKFRYISRQLIYKISSKTLQKALMKPEASTMRSVANWQFVSALQLWCKVVSTQAELQQLHLPLVQIIFGVFGKL